jgi:glycosyltransferase involved in cell wall biosynthesis
VLREFPGATLTLVGAGAEDASLRALASDLGLSRANVQFVGPVPPDQIWRFYSEADIYLQTPDIDNMPSSVLEAFASGCAVVSTDVGGVPAIVTDGVNGLLVSAGDHAAAGERVGRLLREPDLARALTTQAREQCERYRWSAVRTQWLSLYRSLANSSAVPAPRAI